MQVRLNRHMDRFSSTLAERVRRKRKALGISQEQLAKKSGLKQPDISKIERGDIQKTTGIVGLARALNCDPYWLETGVESQTTQLPAHPYNFHKIIGLEEACNTLARYFEDMPEEDRDNAVRWLSGLVHRPSSAPHVIGALAEMVTTPRKSPTEEKAGTTRQSA